MPRPTKQDSDRGDARSRLLEAALDVIRRKGYSATTIDDLCVHAGVTKGAFFHHFKGKSELGVAAVEHWTQTTSEFFADAPIHGPADPVARVLAYIDFRKSLLMGDVPEFSCLAGTMVQELHETAPPIREACERSIVGHASMLEADIEAAVQARNMTPDWTSTSLALYTQAVIQGAIILAKATGKADRAADCLDHLRRHIELLFCCEDGLAPQTKRKKSR